MMGPRRSFAPVKEGEELDVKIEAVGEKGDGIAKKDGFVLFIPNTHEGDEVRIRVTKVLRKVGFAEVLGQAQESPVQEESAPAEEEPAPEDSENFGEESDAPAEESQEDAVEEAPAEEAKDSSDEESQEDAVEEAPAEEVSEEPLEEEKKEE